MAMNAVGAYQAQSMPPVQAVSQPPAPEPENRKTAEIEAAQKQPPPMPNPTETMGNNVNVMA